MKAEAKTSGVVESGFQRVKDGWHVMEFQEGIEILKDADGEEIAGARGDALHKIPFKVNDEEDDSHEVEFDYIATENAKGEQMIVDFLGATSLWAKFLKAFPEEDDSVFDEKCMKKLKTKLPGELMRIKTKQNEYVIKKGERAGQTQIVVNIVAFGKMSDSVADLEKTLFPEKAGSTDAGDGGAGDKKKDEDPDEDF